MASERSVLSIPSLATQQTPCDTLPVPQNLVSKLTETPDSPISIAQKPAMISMLAQAPLSTPMDMSEGQETLGPQNLPARALRKYIDHAMLDVSSATNISQPGTSTRKLCVRHKRMADEGANVAMQQASPPLATHHS